MGRGRLPTIKWDIAAGEVTKANPVDVGEAALELAQNADGFEELRAVGQVNKGNAKSGSYGQIPGSTRMSHPTGETWHSLHYYEHYDFAGDLQREVLGQAGTDFYKIEEDTSLIPLKSGLYEDPLTGAIQADKIFFVSPKNEPFKFDGVSATPWGVSAPGQHKTVVQSFTDKTDFTVAGGTESDANGIASGDGSLQVDKDDVSTAAMTVSHTFASAVDFTGAGQDLIHLWVLFPEGSLAKLSQGDYAAKLTLTDSGALENEYYKQIGTLAEGRNILSWNLTSPDVDGIMDLSDVTDFEIEILFDAPTREHDGFRFDDLYYTEEGALEPTISGGGSVTGVVSYRVTFVNSTGQESNAGPASDQVDAGSGKTIELTDIPVSPDDDVVARRIYRDLNSDQLWVRIVTINNNVDMTYTDNISTASRSSVTPPLASDPQKDYSPPPRMQQVINYRGYMIGIDADRRFQMNINYKNRPEAWPTDRIRQFESEIVALVPHYLGLMICSTDRIWIMSGTEWSNFRFDPLTPSSASTTNVGVSGWRAWTSFKRIAYMMHDDGPYLQDGIDPWYIGSMIKDRVEGLDSSLFRDAIMVNDRARFRILTFIGDDILVWSYGQAQGEISTFGAGVDPLDGRAGSWSRITLPAGITVTSAAMVETGDRDRPECWIGCDDGFVYWLGDPDAINFANGYGQSPVECVIQTGWSNAETGITFLARFMHVVAKATNRATWSFTLESAETPDSVAGDDGYFSHTFDVVLKAGSSKQELPVMREASIRGEYLKLTMSNLTINENGLFRDVETEVVPKRRRRQKHGEAA